MNILMLHPHDPFVNPWTIRILKLGEYLQKSNNNVTIAYVKNRFRNRLPIVRQDLPTSLNFIELPSGIENAYSNLKTILCKAKISDIIHIQKCISTTALPALLTGFLADKPIHYDWDDNETSLAKEWATSTILRGEVRTFEKSMPALVDTISVSSECIYQKAIKSHFPKERIFKIPVGIEQDMFKHADREKVRNKLGLADKIVISYMGQLDGGSYPEIFIDSLPRVLKNRIDIIYMIIGGGARLNKLKGYVKQHSLETNIIFTDYIDYSLVPAYLSASDILVASFEDNEITKCKSPLKIVEYMMSEKPVVASNVGEVSFMLENCAILVPPNSSADIANGIIAYLQNKSLMEINAKKALKRAENLFTWDKHSDTLLKAYNQAINFLNIK